MDSTIVVGGMSALFFLGYILYRQILLRPDATDIRYNEILTSSEYAVRGRFEE